MGMRGYRRREEISAVSTLVLSATWNYLPRRHDQAYVLGQRWDGGGRGPLGALPLVGTFEDTKSLA